MSRTLLAISVVYALPDRQTIVELTVEEGTTVAQAVSLSNLATRFKDIGESALQCAIFSRVVPATHPVAHGDRVEILRPLLIDPKESRRRAAARGTR
jgi:putative ubiquitin-RnfH superfamily antitoxin RatB of RatAB toxin-antitoxin module